MRTRGSQPLVKYLLAENVLTILAVAIYEEKIGKRKVAYVARKYGLTWEEAFKKLTLESPPLRSHQLLRRLG